MLHFFYLPFCYISEFNTKAGFERLVSFLSEISKIIAKYLKSERDVRSKVLDFHHPHQLREQMDHCLYVDEKPRDLEQVLSDCKETLKYCVKTGKKEKLQSLQKQTINIKFKEFFFICLASLYSHHT
jgi:hypothetical protein